MPVTVLLNDSNYFSNFTTSDSLISKYCVVSVDWFVVFCRRACQLMKKRICKRWRQKCQPWTSVLDYQCCDGLTCRCNLWVKNCKCVSRLWG